MRCLPAHYFTVAKARAWRASIDDDPSYQRAGDAWTLAQQQRFIDSLLNGFDVPKIYFHDLRGVHPTKVYAVVDGKQRLTAIWEYLDGDFPLADDALVSATPGDDLPSDAVAPSGPLRFAQLDPAWQQRLLQTFLSVVLIRDASEADIDELFARLNDGTPLTAAERRNAIAGDMSALVRELAGTPSLAAILSFPDVRGAYRDVAAAILALEWTMGDAPDREADLSAAGLDAFVRANRRLETERRQALMDASGGRLEAVRGALDAGAPALTDVPTALTALHAGLIQSATAVQDGDLTDGDLIPQRR